eukprot:3609057-Rhodomonas_salina.1
MRSSSSHVSHAPQKPEDEKKKKKEKAIKGAPVEQSSKTPVGRFRCGSHPPPFTLVTHSVGRYADVTEFCTPSRAQKCGA